MYRLALLLLLLFSVYRSNGQNDLSVGTYYRLNLQRQTLNADAYILHNAKVDAASSAIFRWETSHPSFGSRGIVFNYYNGIQFFADAIATSAGSPFTPSSRMIIANNGNIGFGTDTPRGKFDVDGTGDIFLVDDVNAGTTQSVFLPGHIYLSPYDGGDVSYLQARRYNNAGTTSLRFRTYDNGSLTEAIHIEGDGSVGIGTLTPEGLQINASLSQETSLGTNNIRIGVLGGTPRIILDHSGYNTFQVDNLEGRLRIFTPGVERLTVLANGNVGIGTSNPGTFRLAVEGKIGAREVNVNSTSPWPDYVFQTGYSLPPLQQVKHFIERNRHLPDIPTAEEVESSGIQLGEMNVLLLKKIEELTLYVIELKEENQKQDKLIQELQQK